jgi:hypothetical protein
VNGHAATSRVLLFILKNAGMKRGPISLRATRTEKL